jgi:predicted DNA-binding transcriptional regulator AlpA
VDDARRRLDLLHVLGDGADFAMVDRLLVWLDTHPGAVYPEDLVGLSEAAAILGVSRQRLWNWTADPKKHFPRPIVTLKSGPIFVREQVEQWKTGNTDLI